MFVSESVLPDDRRKEGRDAEGTIIDKGKWIAFRLTNAHLIKFAGSMCSTR
jgi:hypothetical protein